MEEGFELSRFDFQDNTTWDISVQMLPDTCQHEYIQNQKNPIFLVSAGERLDY